METPLTPELAILCDWIRSKQPQEIVIGLDTDLIDSRLIDSMEFAEFLFTLETVSGKAIDIGDVEVDTFRTLRSIQSKFLQRG